MICIVFDNLHVGAEDQATGFNLNGIFVTNMGSFCRLYWRNLEPAALMYLPCCTACIHTQCALLRFHIFGRRYIELFLRRQIFIPIAVTPINAITRKIVTNMSTCFVVPIQFELDHMCLISSFHNLPKI